MPLVFSLKFNLKMTNHHYFCVYISSAFLTLILYLGYKKPQTNEVARQDIQSNSGSVTAMLFFWSSFLNF